jgi:hypothetical protein
MGHLRVVSLGAGARIESLLVHSHSVDGGKADWPFAIYYAAHNVDARTPGPH